MRPGRSHRPPSRPHRARSLRAFLLSAPRLRVLQLRARTSLVLTVLALRALALSADRSTAADGARGGLSDCSLGGFESLEPAACGEHDAPDSLGPVRRFFEAAREVDSRHVHDHFDLAPCWREGRLRRNGETCSWRLRPGGVGVIDCGRRVSWWVREDTGG